MPALLDHLPPRLRAPVQRVLRVGATSLWVAPLLVGLVAAVLAVVLVTTDPLADLIPLRLGDQEAVRSTLTSIISATIAATSLTVTGTIIALQLATGQYSPRLLRGVLTDGGVRWTLATFVGTVVYLLIVVGSTTEDALPEAAVGLAFLLGVVVIGLLVFFVHHIVQRLRLETIISDVTERTLATVDETHPADHTPRDVPAPPDDATGLPARRSGYLQETSLRRLGEIATEADVHLRVRVRIGDFLTRGTTAAWVWREDGTDELPDADDLADKVDEALVLGVDRTLRGDPAYGLRHLVDIGLRAVSPGVNDPTTAVQCINHATRVLVALSNRTVVDGVVIHDGLTAVLPKPDLAQHVELAQAQLLHYGGGDARVVDALASQLRDVVEGGTAPERIAIVRERLERLRDHDARRDHDVDAQDVIDNALARVEGVLAGEQTDDDDTPAG